MTKLSKDMRPHAAHKCMYRSEVKIIKDPVNQGKIWSILLCLTEYLITTSWMCTYIFALISRL